MNKAIEASNSRWRWTVAIMVSMIVLFAITTFAAASQGYF